MRPCACEGPVVLVDGNERILLIRVEDPTSDQPVHWVTPGGACENSETPEQGALHELFEETGISVTKLGPCVWRRHHGWRWDDRMIDSDEHYFFLRLEGTPAVHLVDATDLELNVFREYRWWSLAELDASLNGLFVPRRLPALVRPLLRGEFPTQPIDTGV